ncbi:phosphosulfolactate synthase [Calidifontibacillus erzurumensis]|uniref:Phosphosulfolactate synthase n=1 Tax=Calidifontibacillus erzurumensis TaxID=2741433 RepID=A0A8J8GBR3_9BACI|nr:phosphosulfolactate synthase [Calidifontibacillus erzurumensis]NSL50884.1 phosphosulfolactate synthase [Calidifontibacillus erzurumensis]
MNFLDIPKRTRGDRVFGLTSIADFGIPIGQLRDFLEDYCHYIDIAKLGVGSAYITPNIADKVKLYKDYGIKVYCGGTLFEKSYYQGKLKEYKIFLQKLGIEWIEVSNGTLDIPLEERIKIIREIKQEFYVLGEVGSKKQNYEMSPNKWVLEMNALLDAGCKYVITEGRDSGTAGIYNQNGEVKKLILMELAKKIDINRIIFEAPTSKQQMFFINTFGPNVNLGNVKIQDVLLLETERVGLRSDTFFMIPEPSKI